MASETELAKREHELNTWFQETIDRIVANPDHWKYIQKAVGTTYLAIMLSGYSDIASMLGYVYSKIELEAINQGLDIELGGLTIADNGGEA